MIQHAAVPSVSAVPTGPADPSSPVETAPGYQPGVCNIGPAEIARRRRGGHIALAATVGLFATLVLIEAPQPARLLVALPAIGAASGYLQARFRFCAGFASRGVYNFGEVGPMVEVVDPEAKARDRARARQIGVASVAIGAAVGAVAAILPL